MLSYFFDYCQTEFKIIRNEEVIFKTLEEVDYKTASSIINKLWRSYKFNRKRISLEDIKKEITDLIRTEIIGDTLSSCRFLAERFRVELIQDKVLKKRCEKKIKEIEFEPEMKMSSGYFAYHILIHFKDDIVVEIEIFSAIIKKWRELSYNLYEIARISEVNHAFGSKESRLISLGHLFHLAECEMERLQDDFNSKAPKI